MKLTLKFFLLICLLFSTAFAEGDVNHGQRDDDSSGDFVCAECVFDDDKEMIESKKDNQKVFLLKILKEFFDSFIG